MKDEEFFAKLLETFRIEADEHLKALSDGLLALEGDLPPEKQQEMIENIFREAHSLKGAGRAVNQYVIEKICQSLENVLSDWKKGLIYLSRESFDVLHLTLDTITSALTTPPDQNAITQLIEKLDAIREMKIEKNASLPSISASEQPIQRKMNKNDLESSPPINPPTAPPNAAFDTHETKPSPSKETGKEKSIRVSLQKMNKLFQEAEELLLVKLIAQQQVGSLKLLHKKQRDREKELNNLLSEIQNLREIPLRERDFRSYQESINQTLSYLDRQLKEVKPSKEELYRFIKVSEQNVHFVDSIVDALIEDMKKILMQPMQTLFEVVPRMVRNLAQELKKEIEVQYIGGDIEVDRRILEEIKDPLIHLIRNAIDHGIESPQEREQAKKSATGMIKIIATESEGNSVALSIIDDGRGIDMVQLKNATVEKGLISQKEAAELSDDEAIKLAFHSGVSTSPTVTELSGRGLGLGIVSEKVDRLGGQVIVESQPHLGTKFTLLLPLTLATFRGIHITVAGKDFIMPTHNVKRVLRVKTKEIQTVANQETIIADNRSIPYFHLADILGLTRTISTKPQGESFNYILLISATEKTVAFGADEVHQEQEVLVKGLGKQCVRIKNIMAATIMEWGNVIPILNPIDLIRSSIKGKISPSLAPESQEESIEKEILLVEDSITTRLLIKNILESAGYIVQTAVDGIEGLEILKREAVDLLLTDIEMPRMDGFTLIEKVKEIENLQRLPVIILTSRGSQEDRERGMELGADAYLDKSHFTQQELTKILKKLL